MQYPGSEVSTGSSQPVIEITEKKNDLNTTGTLNTTYSFV